MKALQDWFRRVMWTGIVVNMLFVIPLVIAPGMFLDLLGIQLTDLILARASGMLLFIISVFYIPAARNPTRYRANAWMHFFPSRFCGATFFFAAVLGFGYEPGYLSIAIVDAVFGLTALAILLAIVRRERAEGATSGWRSGPIPALQTVSLGPSATP